MKCSCGRQKPFSLCIKTFLEGTKFEADETGTYMDIFFLVAWERAGGVLWGFQRKSR